MTPLVSIIIPIYNVELFLEEAVLSACNQTYTNIEIILVNDGSTDNSNKVCIQLALKDTRIKVINKPNGGLSSARNAGIENASGDFLFFLDGDDFIDKKCIEILVSKILNNKNIGIVSAPCFYRYISGEINIFKKKWEIKSDRIITYDSFCKAVLLQQICHSACCKLFDKKILENILFRKGKKNEDTLFMFDLSKILIEKKINLLEIPDKLYYYRITDGSITRNISQPIEIFIIENLQDMQNEDVPNPQIKHILKQLYHDEIISFYSYLLLKKNDTQRIQSDLLKRFYSFYKTINLFSTIKYASKKNIIKYIMVKYAKSFYLKIYKFKNIN